VNERPSDSGKKVKMRDYIGLECLVKIGVLLHNEECYSPRWILQATVGESAAYALAIETRLFDAIFHVRGDIGELEIFFLYKYGGVFNPQLPSSSLGIA